MTNTIEASIKQKLREIEQAEDVRVILAVESGSRAWGFASPDSDYYVRFIYVRREEDYLRLNPPRDVIEWQLDDVYDINGWDLQKALRLLHDSNPTVHEWCNSPIVYMESELADPFRTLVQRHFLPKPLMFHYVSMAERNCRAYLTGEEVKRKKYFYMLRPVLAARWVSERRSAPPMLFDQLVESQLPGELLPAVEELLAAKKETSELGTGAHVPELDAFMQEQITELRVLAEQEENKKNTWEELDAFFRMAVMKKYRRCEEIFTKR